LALQLAATAGSIFMFGLNPTLSQWMSTPGSVAGLAVPILSLMLSTVTWFIMMMSSDEQRRSKVKWTLLTLFTTGEAISVGYLSSFFKFRSVLLAMLTTAMATASVSLYTFSQRNAQYDLSQWGTTLSSCGLIFLCYGTLQLLQLTGILPKGFIIPYNEVLYSMIGATLFSFYLAHHTKLIVSYVYDTLFVHVCMNSRTKKRLCPNLSIFVSLQTLCLFLVGVASGKHSKYQMNEKDYVFGAMSLYNDIISLFIYVLKLLGKDKDD
jgi:FtsH-binding integral membrane protein